MDGVGNVLPFAGEANVSTGGFRTDRRLRLVLHYSWKKRKKQQTGWVDDAWMEGVPCGLLPFPGILGWRCLVFAFRLII